MKLAEPPASSSPDTTRRFAKRLALVFFFAWLVVLLAGADHPPPPGFLLVVVLDAIAGAGIYYRVPHYLQWQSARRPRRLLRVVGDGVAIGLAFAAVPVLFGSGEPSVTPRPIDMVIWFTVVAAVGVANTMLVYACVVLYRRMTIHRAAE